MMWFLNFPGAQEVTLQDWCIELKSISRLPEFQIEVSNILRNSEYSKDRLPLTIPLSKVRNNQLLYAIIDKPDRQESFLKEALDIQVPDLKDKHHLFQVRFTQHPRAIPVKDIHARDIGRLIAVKGIVKQVTEIQAKTVQEAYVCRLCGDVQMIDQDGRVRKKPVRCLGDDCKSKEFLPLIEQSVYCDNQKMRMQDDFDELKAGQQPETLDIEADDDLTHTITGGEHVILTGILRLDQSMEAKTTNTRRWLDLKGVEKMGEDSSSMLITEEDEKQILAMSKSPTLVHDIVKSMAPKIFGSEMIKLAIVLQQFGGVSHVATETTVWIGVLHQ